MSIDNPIRITLEQDGNYSFRVHFHDTGLEPLLTDESPPLGQDAGPNPARLLLASVANCLAASLLFALRKFRNSPDPIRAEICAVPARNGQGRWRIGSAKATLHLPGHNADYKSLDRALAQFEDFCVVTQSVRQGIDVDVVVVDRDGRVLMGDKSFEAGS